MTEANGSNFLAELRVALPTFQHPDRAPFFLEGVWKLLRARNFQLALQEGRRLIRENAGRSATERAALYAAAAVAAYRCAYHDEAESLAQDSLSHQPGQWSATAVRIAVFEARQQLNEALDLAARFNPSAAAPSWDEIPSREDLHLLVAAFAWRAQAWDKVADRAARAYPEGVESMPPALQQDWFRLAFYRNTPSEAAAAARAVAPTCAAEDLDEMLNAMVQHGWVDMALPLYREAFNRHEDSQLLRRRLVGLCIRTGEMEEARRLASTGALNILV